MNLKEIRFPIEIKSVNHARSYILQKAYTNDLNSIKIIFELLDCTTADLTGATASILLYMRDGSFFQDTATITDNTVTYTLTEAQGNHSGVAQTQVIVKKTGTEWASSKEKFEIVSGLETVVATEVMIKDWTMLTAEARAFIDAAEAAEALRLSAESSRLTAEQGRVTAETGRANAESARVTAEQGRVAQLAEFEQHKLDYVEYIKSQLDFELLELNENVKDEIVVENGKATHMQRVREYVLQESDLIALNKNRQYVDTITVPISNMVGVVPAEPFSKPVFKIDGFIDSGSATIKDELQSIGTYVYSSSITGSQVVLIVEKDKYATSLEARADLAGTKIIYQLADPVITELTNLSYNTRQVINLEQRTKELELQKVKVPKAPLTLTLVGETDPAKTGIRYLTTGWHDKALYGIARVKIFRAAQVDNPDTWEMGVNLPTTIYEHICHLHVSNKGIVLITKKTGENPKVWFMQDINSEPVLRHEFIFTPSADTLHDFNITSHSDGINDYIIACQYGKEFYVRNMYLSKDMGTTWTVINQSSITTVGDVNSHWHTAKFDPYMSRIWAVEGDGTNKAISYSDDLGETWVRLSGGIYQPTLIYPFPKRVVFGRDRGISPPGLDQWIRSDVPFEQKYITESLSFREDKFAYQNYPSQQISGYGEEIYINFTKRYNIDEQYIYATGDGGESWHCVYSGGVGTGIVYLGNPSGVTADGKIAFALREYGEGNLSYPLVYADAIEWV